MKKLTLLTVTALTVAGLGMSAQPMATHAAVPQRQIQTKGNRVIISYSDHCNIQNVLDRLENCFPNLIFPGCQLPDINKPECDVPETDMPETNVPETEAPETNVPDVELPGTNTPDTNLPETEAPETNIPGGNAPDNNTGNGSTGENHPENNVPENNTPENNTPENDSDQDSTGEHAYIKEVVRLVNIERAKEGLSALTIDTKVQAAAMVRARECEQLFSHTRPDGSTFASALLEQNVSFRSAGENIAWGQKTPAEVVNAWMNSPGHRANIMNKNYTTIGVGYYENARGTDYWCQLFTR